MDRPSCLGWPGDSGRLNEDTEQLHLPESTGPANWWLTEFEDSGLAKPAPADVYFSPDENYTRKRPSIILYVKVSQPADGGVFLVGQQSRWRCG